MKLTKQQIDDILMLVASYSDAHSDVAIARNIDGDVTFLVENLLAEEKLSYKFLVEYLESFK